MAAQLNALGISLNRYHFFFLYMYVPKGNYGKMSALATGPARDDAELLRLLQQSRQVVVTLDTGTCKWTCP